MDGGVDAHGHRIGVLTRDALIHFEQITVAFTDDLDAQPLDGIAEVEIHARTAMPDPTPLITNPLDGTRRHITRYQVAEARVHPFEEVIAILLRDLVGRTCVPPTRGHPDAPVV